MASSGSSPLTHWERTVVGGETPSTLVKAEVHTSWARSKASGVSPSMPAAPVELSGDALVRARHETSWVQLAESVLTPQLPLVVDSGHVLTLFDARGRMISSRGDAHALEALRDIHFMPGANWSEGVVGTNGPGTALASGQPVHIVGAEHFCEAWHPWHCAAAPIRAPHGSIVGALDVSGAQASAQPWSLQLVQLLAGCVEQALVARSARWREALTARFAELVARYPNDLIAAVDEHGRLVWANPQARSRGVPPQLSIRRGQVERAFDVPLWLGQAQVHEVHEGDVRLGACVIAAGHAPASRGSKRMTRTAAPTRYTFEDFIGRSSRLTSVIDLARAAAATSMPVLVLGESGVGKELLAQSIHAAGPRRHGPFVAVNCAALSSELIESELFGYEGGAFSGSRAEGQPGKFDAADHGTLFLDEVAELPLTAQAALLRVLQEGEVTAVGATTPHRVDVRVLAATNRPLEQAVQEGRFRLDLFHRLSVVPMTLPPLRERLEDLPELVGHLNSKLEAETGLKVRLSSEVRQAFERFDWPGNIRQLDNVLRRLAVACAGREAGLGDLPNEFSIHQRSSLPTSTSMTPGDETEHVHKLMSVIDSAANMTEAASRLGMTRSTLYRQLDRYGLRARRTMTRRP